MGKSTRNIQLSRRKVAVIFDKRRLPVEGDTITVGNMVAVFRNLSDEYTNVPSPIEPTAVPGLERVFKSATK